MRRKGMNNQAQIVPKNFTRDNILGRQFFEPIPEIFWL
jgi:hypothetical protein